MRDRFETTLLDKISDTFVNGNRQARLPNTSNISFTGIDSGAALILLDQHGICCSAGSACRTGSLEASHVLRAMKLSDERARSNVRFSFGRFNTEADVDKALEIVPKVIAKLRAVSHPGPLYSPEQKGRQSASAEAYASTTRRERV
jgi:cysteine desulfurase